MLAINDVQVYYGGSQILRDVSMEVPSNKVVCLLGRNGVGKTTLLKSIMGVLKPRTGHIKYTDDDILHWPPYRRARAGIAYVPQGRGIFPFLSVRENLLMGLEAVRVKDENRLVEMYQLFPVLKEMARRMAGTLSGGQQQQLAIARALISKPKLLLLDEPTEGIQPSIVLEIEQVLLQLQQQGQISILLVEQFLDFALGLADYCYIMDNGGIVAQGTPLEITQSNVMEYLSV